MSLSGSSASRNNICAMTRLAISSSIYVGRKMMRSLRSREKMSNARSPRGVCSTTIGTKPIERLLRCARRGAPPPSMARSGCMGSQCTSGADRGPFNKEVERALHGLLGARPHLLEHLRVVPRHPLRVHALAAHLLADMLDLVPDLAQHHRSE